MRLRGDPKYLLAAEKALRPFHSVATGGVVNTSPVISNQIFYEEYPTNPPTLVLNGFMFTVVGLHDLSYYSKSATRLFAWGYRTLLNVLPLYDVNGLGLYSLTDYTLRLPGHNYASQNYARVHITLLGALNDITPNPRLIFYASRWQKTLPLAPSY